jgi:hypothetical protein
MYARRARFQRQNSGLTLGDAVAAVSAVTADEREVVAVVLHMLQRQSIRLACAPPLQPGPAPALSDRGVAQRPAGRAGMSR